MLEICSVLIVGSLSKRFVLSVTKGAVDGDEGMLNYIDEGSIA